MAEPPPDTPAAAVFDDGKAPDALRTIGEVAKALGLKQHVLRYWEEQFPTLRPLTRAGGRRYYRPEDIALVQQINRLLHHEGYTIKGARQALLAAAGKPQPAASDVAPTPAPSLPAFPAPSPAPSPAPGLALSPGGGEDEVIEALRILAGHLATIRDHLAEAVAD
ncbi:MerR family transcriptional regulator [Novosphingobium huizhouense]|uniref:MerR family transcriptional regulator n=1 Tax=Novosphingobium huizhouense TaxID=2866625 RepID=UPI001CD8D2B8|nr:MerR family transcriptional regulator [Novosphingobium huizhouense]